MTTPTNIEHSLVRIADALDELVVLARNPRYYGEANVTTEAAEAATAKAEPAKAKAAKTAKAKTTKAAPKGNGDDSAKSGPTQAELRQALSRVIREKGPEVAKDIMGAHGAQVMSELPPHTWGEVISAAKEHLG